MRLRILLAAGVMQCCLLAGVAQTASAGSAASAPPKQQAKAQPARKAAENLGEKKFEQNCNRCHNAPQELPRRITGTVLLHMRVRASLSEADERAILHFLAP
jgi:cytochrome c5